MFMSDQCVFRVSAVVFHFTGFRFFIPIAVLVQGFFRLPGFSLFFFAALLNTFELLHNAEWLFQLRLEWSGEDFSLSSPKWTGRGICLSSPPALFARGSLCSLNQLTLPPSLSSSLPINTIKNYLDASLLISGDMRHDFKSSSTGSTAGTLAILLGR